LVNTARRTYDTHTPLADPAARVRSREFSGNTELVNTLPPPPPHREDAPVTPTNVPVVIAGPDQPKLSTVGRLAEIPGVGARIAQNIIAEVGVDMAQFPTPDRLASWAKGRTMHQTVRAKDQERSHW